VAERPRGTVTFLFTDVEGSTRLLKQLRDRYGAVLAEHQRLLRDAFAAHGGEEVDTQGDAFFYVFSRARDAAAAAADGQRALASHDWPEGAEFRVRMGMHTGEPVLSDEGRYHGMGVNRTARIMAAGHGGQILASQSTASVLGDDDVDGVTLRDLGEHNLKDLARPERIYQLQVAGLEGDFAPLKTESAAPAPLYQRPLVVGAFAGVVAAAIAIPVFALGGGSGSSLSALSANSVGIVNPATGAIDDEIADVPTPTRVAASDDAIWVTSADTNSVSRIDVSSKELRDTIRVGDGPSGIAFGAGDIWVANTLAGTVSRIDPDSNDVVGAPIRVGNSPTAVAFGEGSVWVTNIDDQSVSRIDPKDGSVETIDVGAAGRGIAVGGGAVWIGDSARNRVVRVNPETNEVTQPIGVGSGPGAVAFGGGAVWVANTLDGTVSRIDPATNRVGSTVTVGASPNAIAASDDAVWVANEAEPTIVRLDPRTGSVAQTVRTGARPTGLTIAGSLWVAGQASAGTHRGGTLVYDDTVGDREIDPALAYSPTVWSLLNITNDGLVGFKHVGGSEGSQLVPDLATSLPTPTDAGKTYAFQLRKGIHFSNGSLLKASAVRSTFERLFKAGTPVPSYYTSIRGGSACFKHPKACDLSNGIVTDDATGTVTFRLTARDPEFLYRLALTFASIVPADTPLSKRGTRPVPATGPYVIRSPTPKLFILVRNRHFRVWNAIAQPDGYADRIKVSLGSEPRQAATKVARGAADVVNLGAGFAEFGARLTQFETQHPAQVRTTPAPATLFWFLNTCVPPFDDIRARQAVNYALDRDKLVQIHGGQQTAQATCQVLPPNFPGYRPYCPYTANPGPGGAWSAPNLARARELVRQSGTTGARVTFWGWKGPEAKRELDLARAVLTRLGYRVSVKAFPDITAQYDALVKAPTSGLPQAGYNGWFVDYPAAANFFNLVSCSTAGDQSINLSGFCSRELEAKLRRASTLQAQDQDAGAKVWAQVDRAATDLAPWVPTITPRNVDLVSKRVGNYQHHPLFGVLLDQLWVR
jgi:YVTN family beta-propeller protein